MLEALVDHLPKWTAPFYLRAALVSVNSSHRAESISRFTGFKMRRTTWKQISAGLKCVLNGKRGIPLKNGILYHIGGFTELEFFHDVGAMILYCPYADV